MILPELLKSVSKEMSERESRLEEIKRTIRLADRHMPETIVNELSLNIQRVRDEFEAYFENHKLGKSALDLPQLYRDTVKELEETNTKILAKHNWPPRGYRI